MKVTPLKDRIEDLLTRLPHLRDNDNKLLSNIWHKELKQLGYHPVKISGFQLLEVVSEGMLSPLGSIIRCRAKLQQENPTLRGERYLERHQEEAPEMEQDLREFNQV